MAHIALNNKLLERYFRFLKSYDKKTKKAIISMLSESLNTESETPDDKKPLSDLFGAWKDKRDSDDIIEDIISSRVENRKIEEFE